MRAGFVNDIPHWHSMDKPFSTKQDGCVCVSMEIMQHKVPPNKSMVLSKGTCRYRILNGS